MSLLERYPDFPELFLDHWQLSAMALALGTVLATIVSWLGIRFERLQYPLLTCVGVIQTIPGLALLALSVAGLAAINEVSGELRISSLGFVPAITALTLYSMLPIVRNTITGIKNVDPSLVQAATGLGMTAGQVLRRVELPLALPVIVAGFRTAAVWTVGAATLATPVGQSCLGNYIFTGLHTRDWAMVVMGCVGSAVMAIALDSLLGMLQYSIEKRKRWLSRTLIIGVSILFAVGLASPDLFEGIERASGTLVAGTQDDSADGTPVRQVAVVKVGAKTFTEQYILAEVIKTRLRDAGCEVQQVDGLGSSVILDGLINGDIDVYVDYSGTLWANALKEKESAASWKVEAEVSGWLAREHNVRCLGNLGFENAYALAMRAEDAKRLNITTIADLAQHSLDMKIGGDYEFFGRPEWKSLEVEYGLKFKDQVSLDSTFMYEAVKNSEVDVISAFSSDGRVAAFDLVVLKDPRQAIPPYDAVFLLSSRVADDARVVDALQPLIGAIRVDVMREANLRVDRDEDKKSVAETAEWMLDKIDLKSGQ